MKVAAGAGTYNVSFLGCRFQVFGRYRHSVRIGRTVNIKVGRWVFKLEIYNEDVADSLYDKGQR